MNWTSVESRALVSIAYEAGKRQLYVRFHSGKVYRYLGFPLDHYEEFLAAESKGRYFGSHIRGKFRDEEVRETRLHPELTHSSGE